MKNSFSRIVRSAPVLAAVLSFLVPVSLRAQVGNDNPTGVSGQFNGNVTTAGSYDPYTGNATRSITDITVAGAVGAYPLSFTRTMNSRYNADAPTWEMGTAGSWRHSYQWSMEPLVYRSSNPQDRWTFLPLVYSVHYPDGRRVSFFQSNNDSKFRNGNGVADRFQQLTDPYSSEGDCYLLLPDGGKVWFHAYIERWENEITHVVTSSFTYEFAGIIDPHGQTTTITYPGDGSMTITEPAGRWLKLWYTATPWMGDSVLTGVQASDGRSVTYNYGGWQPAGAAMYSYLGNVQYRDPGGNVFATAIYAYQPGNTDANGRPLIAWCIDPMYNGPMWAISYTFAPASSGIYGLLQSENYLDPRTGNSGAAVSTLAVNGNSRTETRGDTPSRTFNYSGSKLVNYTDFKGHTSYISYDGNGFRNGFTDARNNATTTTNEGIIGATSVLTHPDQSTQGYAYWYRDGAPYFLQIRGDERGHNTYFTRDTNNFQLTRIDYPDYPNGAYETFTYNNFGQAVTHRMTNGGTETNYYDGRGMLWAQANPDGTAYYYYDAQDRLEHAVDRRGKTTWFQYNARGQVTRTTHIDGSYAQAGYNVDGTLAWTADENHPGAETDANQRTRYVYDDYKRVVSVTNPMNQTTTFAYSPTNIGWYENPYLHTSTALSETRTPMGKITSFGTDANLQRTGLWEADYSADMAYTAYDYDPVGNLTWTQDPRGSVTTLAYDNRGRRASLTNALNQTTTWQYDATNNLTRETRPDQSYRQAFYDSMNRVYQTYGFMGEGTGYGRDLAGNLTQMTDAKGAVYSFGYDLMNRKTSATYPADYYGVNRTETWHFDPAGNLDLYKNPADQYRHLFYDDRNRMSNAWWDNGAAPQVVIAYDFASRVTSVVTNTAQTTAETTVVRHYDDANRLLWEDQTVSGHEMHRLQHDRDADGNATNTNVPGLFLVWYDYTQRNQLAHIYGGNWDPWFTYSYDAGGNMTKRQDVLADVNDSVNVPSMWYDPLNRSVMWENTGGGDNAYARSWYQYDNLGREVATWRDEQGGKGERFGYDPFGQLRDVSYNADQVWTGNPVNPTRTVNYNTDVLNRYAVTANGTATGYAHNATNQYTDVGGVPIGYDGNFNLTSYGGASAAANYDAQSQLVSVNSGGNNVQFVYDGLGRCVKRTINGAAAVIVYDGWKPVFEHAFDGAWLAYNVYGPGSDEILWRYHSQVGHLRYHTDIHGNVTELLGWSGEGLEKYTYDAFGQPTITDWNGNVRTASAYGNRFMFQGREFLSEINVYDFRNRFYFPLIGRFLQKDPLGFDAGDANLFRYCGGDPINFGDPTGLERWYPGMTPRGNSAPAWASNWTVSGIGEGMQIAGAALFLVGTATAQPEMLAVSGVLASAGYLVEKVGDKISPPNAPGGGGDSSSRGSSSGSGGGNGSGGYGFVQVTSASSYWSYSNYEARHEASMANSNFSSTMAPFWDPGNVNDTGTTGDEGHTIYYPNAGTPMGHAEDGVVTPTGGTFQGGRRDPRWVFPSQAESARLGLSFVQNADKYNQWLIAHNQWYYGNKGH
jgi:RHS repeat-associated protein